VNLRKVPETLAFNLKCQEKFIKNAIASLIFKLTFISTLF